MRRFLLSVGVAVLSLALTAAAEAGPKGGSKGGSGGGSKGGSGSFHGGSFNGGNSHGSSFKSGNSHGSSSKNYHMTHGLKLKNGSYYYKGKNHNHWSYKCFDRRYGCDCYWDTGCGCYYYYCQPDECYYPLDYCPYGQYCW